MNSQKDTTGPARICRSLAASLTFRVGLLMVGVSRGWAAGLDEPLAANIVTIARYIQTAPTLPTNTWVKVRGTVTLRHKSGSIFLQEATGALFVQATTNSSLVVGDVVEAVGLVTRNGFSPTLRDGIYRSLGRREQVRPAVVTGPELQTGRYDMHLVQVAGRLVAKPVHQSDRQILHLDADQTIVVVELSDIGERSALSQLRPGSLLEATGVCSIGANALRQPSSIRVQLRSSSDIAVLAAPTWWTPTRAATAAGTAALAALAGLVWVGTLRREVRRKTGEIADRLRREAALEERYRRIVDTALEGVLLLDSDGRIQFLNRFMADMLGDAPAHMVGRPITEFVHPSHRAAADAFFALNQGPSPRHADILLQHRNGSELWVLVATNSFLDENGVTAGTLAMLTNISERKRGEERAKQLNDILERRVQERTAELESANRELESFSYSVSHDLRAPLRAIAGFSDALLEDYGSGLAGEAKQYLNRIRVAALDMNRLIDGLLSLARVSRNELRREGTDLSALAASIIQELRQTSPSRQVETRIQSGLVADVDPNLVRIVYVNLLQNAWKFSSKVAEPRLEVGQMQNGNEPVYFVRDNGIGFDPCHAEKLFKVFHRLHGTSEYEGSGIGLATVQKIVQRHGGRVWAEGKPHSGACFYFPLPPKSSAPVEPSLSKSG